MERSKRNPLSDVSNIHNLTPLSVLREFVAANEVSKPPNSVLKPNSSSTSNKLYSEPSEKSNTSIGSSSVGATFSSKTVRFPHPRLAVCSITSSDMVGEALSETDISYFRDELNLFGIPACNRRQNIVKSQKGREVNVDVSRTPVEKRKDEGNAISVPSSPSASERMEDTQNKICSSARTVDRVRIQKTVGFSIPKERRPDLRPETLKKPRKERESDVTDSHIPIMKRNAIAMAYTSSRTGKLKDIQNNVSTSSILVDEPCQKGVENLVFSSGSVEKVKEKKDMLFCCHPSGKAEKGKANLNSSDHALRRRSATGKDTADTSCYLLEKTTDEDKGILKHTRSAIVQIKETGEEYLTPFTSSGGRAKGRAKSWNTSNSFPDKMKGKEKVNLEVSNIGVSSAVMAVKSELLRKTSEKNKNHVGISSCPPMTGNKRMKNNFDEAGDVKSSHSWTDPQAKRKKKKGSSTDKTSEWTEDFIREQKAYFEDIDNFELPVEEVSQDELD